jgi:uncharacterized protein YnzC (UPF0291/DUF896 family)
MTTDYNYIDAYKIERAFFAIGKGEKLRPKQLRQMQAAFLTALDLCGVRKFSPLIGTDYALRVFRPDGHDFTPEQVEEWREWKKQNGID